MTLDALGRKGDSVPVLYGDGNGTKTISSQYFLNLEYHRKFLQKNSNSDLDQI